MPRPKGATQIKNREISDWYYEDRGCDYSGGKPCLECPFYDCYSDLDPSGRTSFFRAFRKDGAMDWRRPIDTP